MPRGDDQALPSSGRSQACPDAEISNWSGKAIAAARTDLEASLSREELGQPGIYVLLGTDPDAGDPSAYIDEAEVLGSSGFRVATLTRETRHRRLSPGGSLFPKS